MLRVYSTSYSMAGKKPSKLLRTVRHIADTIQEMHDRDPEMFDGVVFRGTSGYSVAFLLQALHKLPVPLMLARKEAECSHNGMFTMLPYNDTPDSSVEVSKLLFVDDLVCSGGTVRKLREDLKPWDVEVSAILCYSNSTGPGGGYDSYHSTSVGCRVHTLS